MNYIEYIAVFINLFSADVPGYIGFYLFHFLVQALVFVLSGLLSAGDETIYRRGLGFNSRRCRISISPPIEPKMPHLWFSVGDAANAFPGNNFFPFQGAEKAVSGTLKKNFGTDTLTRIESGLNGFVIAYMCVSY